MGEGRAAAVDETEVGSYFVANYPPFSVWTADAVERDALPALSSPPAPVPLGLYLHVPFCRKRCHFCYFRVYTDKNAQEVEEYLDVMAREWEIYQHLSGDQWTPAEFRVLRRRHAVVSVGAAAERARETADRRHAVDDRRRRSRSSASPARSPRASWRRFATSASRV